MTTLFISKHPIGGHVPQNGRVGTIDWFNRRLWSCGHIPPEQFILETYHFKKYIFFVDYSDLCAIEQWDLAGERIDIVVRKCLNENQQVDALYYIGTDYNLNIHVLFFDSIAEYFKLKS
jgi:hypothetical protein